MSSYSNDTDFMTYYIPGEFRKLDRYFYGQSQAMPGADFRLIEGMEASWRYPVIDTFGPYEIDEDGELIFIEE